jgi:tRNA threonylcarbamoyladenosine biosynthesis protein TsaE
MKLIFETCSSNETIELGKKIGCFLNKHDVITLNGNLGAGKTTFITGIAKSLGIKKINSPTFNIMKCYFDAKIPLYHIDFYKLKKDANQDIGIDEYIDHSNGIAVIEWAIFFKKTSKIPHLDVKIENIGQNKRKIIFETFDKYYEDKIKKCF